LIITVSMFYSSSGASLSSFIAAGYPDASVFFAKMKNVIDNYAHELASFFETGEYEVKMVEKKPTEETTKRVTRRQKRNHDNDAEEPEPEEELQVKKSNKKETKPQKKGSRKQKKESDEYVAKNKNRKRKTKEQKRKAPKK
jgi:DNA mismatch repair ATPase MutL